LQTSHRAERAFSRAGFVARELPALLTCFFAVSCASAGGGTDVRVTGGNSAVLTGPAVSAEIRNGVITRLRNNLTGEEFTSDFPGGGTDAEWSGRTLSPGSDGASVETAPLGESGVRIAVSKVADNLATSVRFDAATGDMLVEQAASGESGGLRSAGFGVAGLNRRSADLMVPHASGRLVDWRSAREEFRFEWPMFWEAQFALLQGAKGGVMIRAEDADRCAFKELVVNRKGDDYRLSFRTVNAAPFNDRKDLKSVTWRITPYKGNWQRAAALYRAWAEKAYGLVPIHKRGDWVRDARFLVVCGMDPNVLPELAKWAPPAATVLYVSGWRRDGYDRNYPEYATVTDEFPPFLEAAKRMGFRVMLHVNYFGCDPLNPLFEKFKKSQIMAGGELQWWLWPPDPKTADIRFAYINPANSDWRKLLVERFGELRKKYPVDALHLDQTLCVFNDENGLIDGLNCAQGNILLHEDLLKNVPGLVYSGEGLNEVTFRREAFAQRHVYGLNHSDGTWDDEQIDLSHALCSSVMRPYVLINGYLGMANPASSDLWRAWKRAYENWGVIPTYPWPSVEQMKSPTGDLATLKREVKLWTEQELVPDFDTPWAEGARFMYSAKDGGRVVCRNAQGGGTETVWLRDGQPDVRIERRLRGRTALSLGDGSVADWPAYNDKESVGLNPLVTYLVDSEPYPAKMVHLSAIPDGSVLVRSRINDRIAAFSFAPVAGGAVYDFAQNVADARCGTLKDGDERQLEEGGSFEPTSEAGPDGIMRCIFAHPPWKGAPGKRVKGRGETFGEYRIKLPAEPLELVFQTGLRSRATESDGVTFSVSIDGKEVFRRHQPKGEWTGHRLDVAGYAGKEVVIRFVTGPGDAGDVSWDWALWGAPRLVSKNDLSGVVELASPRPVKFAASGGSIDVAPASTATGGMNLCRRSCRVPGDAIFILGDAAEAPLPLDLAAAPREVSVSNGYVSGKPYGYASVAPGTGKCGGVERKGLSMHPPNGGRIYADYLIRLPAGSRPMLSFGCGVGDGASAGELEFVVEANGAQIWSRKMKGPTDWRDVEIDLSEHAGRPMLLSIAVDSLGTWGFDWARLSEPKITDLRQDAR